MLGATRFSLANLVVTALDPFQIGRNYVIFPIWRALLSYYNETKERTRNGVLTVKDLVLRLIILLLAFGVILWTASFMYIAFYYTYMPTIAHSRPAHMQFSACESGKGVCSFPQAYVSLTKKQQLLMVGQPYRVVVVIDLPESPVNQNLGMFSVCAEMRDQKGVLRDHACRSAILHYKSTLLNWISTWLMSPLYILGFREEKQALEVEMFSSFHDDTNSPVTDIYLEIQSRQIEFYSVALQITAHFTGLRYFMFHWPLLSAGVGICTNLFFIIIVCLLSWYHWSTDGEWVEEAKERVEDIKKRRFRRRKSEDAESSSLSSVDEVQSLKDDDDLDGSLEKKHSDESPKSTLTRRSVSKS